MLSIFTAQAALAQTVIQQTARPATQSGGTTPPAANPSILFDANTGDLLSLERAGEPWYPASLTKLMTAFVVFKKIREGKLRLDQKIYVSPLASSQAPSKVGMKPGQAISVDWALQALLVYSANDMAYVLAEGASGSIPTFAQEMNQVARELGMSASHFVNPNGLFDPRQVTSARDLGVLAAVLLKEFPQHAHYFDQDYVPLGKRRLTNRNGLLRSMPEADGMKTGFVCNSGFNLVASATRNGRKLIAVVLGTKSGAARTIAAKQMLEQGFLRLTNSNMQKIATVPNLQRNGVVPIDMTAKVCPRKNPVLMAEIEQVQGWGVTFGTYPTAAAADLALRERLLHPVGYDAPGFGGVVRMPDKTGYAALMWGLDSNASLDLCNKFRTQSALCDVMSPAIVQNMVAAELMARDMARQKVQSPVVQGSDTAGKSPKKEKRVRKKLRK